MGLLGTGKKMTRYTLDSIRGFFDYVVRTYDYFNADLKGFHLNIYGCTFIRNEEGCTFPIIHLLEVHNIGKWDTPFQGETGPIYVEAVPQLDNKLDALDMLKKSKECHTLNKNIYGL